MPTAPVDGLEICYETHGDAANPPLLLVMGFAGQLVAWPEALVEALVAQGFYVIRYDNRDVGASTWLEDAPAPAFATSMARFQLGRSRVRPPYTLVDMAKDAAGLIDHLGVGPVHVWGVSMGGMIAQQLTLDFPDRVKTLTSMMSHTGRWRDHIGQISALKALLGTRPTTRDKAIAGFRALFTAIGGDAFPVDGEALEAIGALSFDRGINPRGIKRHMAAILGSPERTQRLKAVRTPTLVIHGTADPLVPVRGGKHTAQTIPNARLTLIEGLGHSLPSGVWPQIIELLADHTGLGAGAQAGGQVGAQTA